MEKKLVSVIMPVYNADKYLRKAVESILIQTYHDIELLICDDASSDRSLTVILGIKDSRIKIFYNKENQGYLKTCNYLMEKSRGDYITFQDADDWSEISRIEKQVLQFENDPALMICGTYAHYFDSLGKTKIREKILPIEDTEIRASLIKGNQFCGASIMIRSSGLHSVGVYREWFDRIGSEDYDWSARIVEKHKALNIPEGLYNVRISPDSISRKIRDERQLISEAMVKKLIDQRKDGGRDMMERNDLKEIELVERTLLYPYLNDRSLVYRRAADIAWYNNERAAYFLACFKAFYTKPVLLINWKYLGKSILRILYLLK